MSEVLRAHPNWRGLVVWEPVLETDWSAPGASILARTGWRGVRQYWDPRHQLSRELGGIGQIPALAKREDVRFAMGDVIWDAALQYPAGVRWRERGAAEFLGAPVLKVANEF